MSATSRYLMNLEERLNIRLVHRTTRQLSLTGEGEIFCERCRDILGSMKEAEASISEAARNPTGLLRVQASLSFCLLHLTPLLPAFRTRYPSIRIEIVAANRYHDIIENGIDVAVRTRRIEADSQITIRRLAQTRRLLAAAPTTWSAMGLPNTRSNSLAIAHPLHARRQLERAAVQQGNRDDHRPGQRGSERERRPTDPRWPPSTASASWRSPRTSFMTTSPPGALSGFSMTGTCRVSR